MQSIRVRDGIPVGSRHARREVRCLLIATLLLILQLDLAADAALAGSAGRGRPAQAMGLQSSPPDAIDLLLTDRIGLSRRTRQSVLREVERVFAGLGARVHWHQSRSDLKDSDENRGLEIVLSSERPEDAGQNRRTMGIAFAAPGPRFTSGGLAIVFPYKVAEVVSPVATYRSAGVAATRGQYFSQALGRVIAHEIIHILLPEHPHSSGGLMNATQNRSAFIAREPVIDEGCARAFHHALLRPQDSAAPRIVTAAINNLRRRAMTRLVSGRPPTIVVPPSF